MLTIEEIEENFRKYKEQASKFLDFDKVTVVHNGEWLSKLTFKDLIDLTANFSVNDFTSRELIRKRLDEGKRVSLAETLYPLMQGYDSYHLDTDIQFAAPIKPSTCRLAGRSTSDSEARIHSLSPTASCRAPTDGR